MLLVIFGAGASYDSASHFRPVPPYIPPEQRAPEQLDRPPLANQLFENRKLFVNTTDLFPACKPLINLLRKPRVVVERELATFQEQARDYPVLYERLAAIRYYLHLALWQCTVRWREQHSGITNYSTLLHVIDRWRFGANEQVCCVTFNYDTMLEDAIAQVLEFNVAHIYSYINWQNYSLIKLHGSVNWGRTVRGILPNQTHSYGYQRLIKDAATLDISDQYELASPPFPMQRGASDHVIFPALSIPVDKKDEFSCPSSHVEKLEKVIPDVTKIVTIGWRATEEKFLAMLRIGLKGVPDLMIVSGDHEGSEETLKNLSMPGSSNPVLFDKGFSGLIDETAVLESFLHAPAKSIGVAG